LIYQNPYENTGEILNAYPVFINSVQLSVSFTGPEAERFNSNNNPKKKKKKGKKGN
jgi:hypothetical protein